MTDDSRNQQRKRIRGRRLARVPIKTHTLNPAAPNAAPSGLSDPIGSATDFGRVIWRYATAPGSVSFGDGAIVVTARLVPLFWGGAWKTATDPSAAEVHAAIAEILASPYLSEATQYGFQSLTLDPPVIVLSPAPPAPTFSADDAKNMVWDLIDDNRYPEPDDPGGRIIYMVFPPASSTYEDAEAAGAHGEAWDYDPPFDVDYAWVGWCNHGDLDAITETFTHELIEMITDPEPSDGYTVDGFPDGKNEIVDFCFNQTGVVAGHRVSAYYSKRLKACVVPAENDHRTLALTTTGTPLGSLRIREIGSTPAPAGNRCFNGTYSWTAILQGWQLKVTAVPNGYFDPEFEWTVQGQSVFSLGALGPATQEVTSTSDSSADPLSLIAVVPAQAVKAHVAAAGDTLIIESQFGAPEANFDVTCKVKERGLPDGYHGDRELETTVAIAGSLRIMDRRFQSDVERCVQFHHDEARRIIKDIEFPAPDPEGRRPVWVNPVAERPSVNVSPAAFLLTNADLVERANPKLAWQLRQLSAGLRAQQQATAYLGAGHLEPSADGGR